jgi:hypothetical protein
MSFCSERKHKNLVEILFFLLLCKLSILVELYFEKYFAFVIKSFYRCNFKNQTFRIFYFLKFKLGNLQITFD